MKNQRRPLLSLSLFLIPFAFVEAQATSGQTPVSVRVTGDDLEPGNVNVRSGTTVIWVNRTAQPMRIRFLKGVSVLCDEPRGFPQENDGVHSSVEVNAGQVLSLCVLEPKKYFYEIDLLKTAEAEAESKIAPQRSEVEKTLYGSLEVKSRSTHRGRLSESANLP